MIRAKVKSDPVVLARIIRKLVAAGLMSHTASGYRALFIRRRASQ